MQGYKPLKTSGSLYVRQMVLQRANLQRRATPFQCRRMQNGCDHCIVKLHAKFSSQTQLTQKTQILECKGRAMAKILNSRHHNRYGTLCLAIQGLLKPLFSVANLSKLVVDI